MTEPFDAAAARARLETAGRDYGTAAQLKQPQMGGFSEVVHEAQRRFERWSRFTARVDLNAALDALDRERQELNVMDAEQQHDREQMAAVTAERDDLRAALDRTLPAAAHADVQTYANALQTENASLWRQLAAAQAALTRERAAHRVTRAAVGTLLDMLKGIRASNDESMAHVVEIPRGAAGRDLAFRIGETLCAHLSFERHYIDKVAAEVSAALAATEGEWA